jgi:lantibiotic modifying enzyme
VDKLETETAIDSGWTPLLEGDLAARARAVADEIAAALDPGENASPPFDRAPRIPVEAVKCDLIGGWAGIALLHAYLGMSEPGVGHENRASTLIEWAVETLARTSTPVAFASGFPGVAWAVTHLQGKVLSADEDEDPCDEIDQALLTALDRSPWPSHYDLLYGLVGLGIYAFERPASPSVRRCLERVVEHLAETAVERPEGLTWWTPPQHASPVSPDDFPNGFYCLGLAHGVPGVIALTALAWAAGVARGESERLLRGAVSWQLAQKLPDESPSRFASFVIEGQPDKASRSAWCYGDPGVAAALMLAARCVDEPAWEQEALEIAKKAARRPAEDSGVVDAAICHGSAGLALIFHRLYQATGDEELRDASLHWYHATLDLRQPGVGLAGYRFYVPDNRTMELAWHDDVSLLSGAAGVGLVLLAGASDVEPAWDRAILTSVPSRARQGVAS